MYEACFLELSIMLGMEVLDWRRWAVEGCRGSIAPGRLQTCSGGGDLTHSIAGFMHGAVLLELSIMLGIEGARLTGDGGGLSRAVEVNCAWQVADLQCLCFFCVFIDCMRPVAMVAVPAVTCQKLCSTTSHRLCHSNVGFVHEACFSDLSTGLGMEVLN